MCRKKISGEETIVLCRRYTNVVVLVYAVGTNSRASMRFMSYRVAIATAIHAYESSSIKPLLTKQRCLRDAARARYQHISQKWYSAKKTSRYLCEVYYNSAHHGKIESSAQTRLAANLYQKERR